MNKGVRHYIYVWTKDKHVDRHKSKRQVTQDSYYSPAKTEPVVD